MTKFDQLVNIINARLVKADASFEETNSLWAMTEYGSGDEGELFPELLACEKVRSELLDICRAIDLIDRNYVEEPAGPSYKDALKAVYPTYEAWDTARHHCLFSTNPTEDNYRHEANLWRELYGAITTVEMMFNLSFDDIFGDLEALDENEL